MSPLEVTAYVFTIILALAAIVGGFFAYRNIQILREQHRRNTFQALLAEITGQIARRNREIIHHEFKGREKKHWLSIMRNYTEHMQDPEYWEATVKEAIEATIVDMDKLGYFLMRGDPKLIDEAPIWIWTIVSDMWEYLGVLIKHKQGKSLGYAKYFEALVQEAKKRQGKPTAK